MSDINVVTRNPGAKNRDDCKGRDLYQLECTVRRHCGRQSDLQASTYVLPSLDVSHSIKNSPPVVNVYANFMNEDER